MTLTIIIFFIAIIGAFGMLMFRAWEIRTSRLILDQTNTRELSFRYIEKVTLFLIKHLIQWIILTSVKIWYLFVTKSKVLLQNKLPKVNKLFHKKIINDSRKLSFVERAVMESKIKIKKIKEKIKKEHEKKVEIDEVDKIL
jgi:hypothetical protein